MTKVTDLSDVPFIARELMLIKVRCERPPRALHMCELSWPRDLDRSSGTPRLRRSAMMERYRPLCLCALRGDRAMAQLNGSASQRPGCIVLGSLLHMCVHSVHACCALKGGAVQLRR